MATLLVSHLYLRFHRLYLFTACGCRYGMSLVVVLSFVNLFVWLRLCGHTVVNNAICAICDRMPILTLQEMEQMTPLFRGKAGRTFARGVMCLLSVDKMNALYDRNARFCGPDFARSVLQDLGIVYEVVGNDEAVDGLKELAKNGPFITVSNHPYGGIDGIILADFLGHLSPDYKIMVNELLGRVEALSSSFIAVTPTGTERTVPTSASVLGVRHALGQLHSGGGLGLFPAGAVSDFCIGEWRVRDREWQIPIVRLIAKARVPVVPVRFFDGNSWLYYSLGLVDWRVRLLRLPAELFNKAGHPIRLGIGSAIGVEEQRKYLATHTTEEFGLWLRDKVYGMSLR